MLAWNHLWLKNSGKMSRTHCLVSIELLREKSDFFDSFRKYLMVGTPEGENMTEFCSECIRINTSEKNGGKQNLRQQYLGNAEDGLRFAYDSCPP